MNLPPRLPPELEDLQRAVHLLSIWNPSSPPRLQAELQALLEALPVSKTEARKWKISLRALAREVAAEPDPEATKPC